MINASDDILVHGKTIEEHDNRFKKLEQRLRDNNLTINESKRIFRQQKIKFYGVILSECGLELDPGKPPATKSEVRSFLGIVNYCAFHRPLLFENQASSSPLLGDQTNKKVLKTSKTS